MHKFIYLFKKSISFSMYDESACDGSVQDSGDMGSSCEVA